ncbi:MAG: SPASM domain-containing protein [Planctomycetes bacterium]|nr:SPASM domain-containing protein [Planctomycetota bacterium]
MPLWHNITELMDYYIPPLPSIYWLDITRRCNLRCLMCPQSCGLSPRPAQMSLDLLKGIVDDICGNRPLLKLYASGEPLLHEGLFEIIDYAGARACRTMIHTNATSLTPEIARRILSSSLTFLSFSFDGCSREVYERLRPPAAFEEVRSNIRQYLDLRRLHGHGPHTTIEIIRMRDTDLLIQPFVEEWMASGVDDVRIAPYLTWHGLVEDRHVEQRLPMPLYKPCAAPFQHGCILSDGTAVPCCLDINGELPLGNVARQRFQEIWSGDTYRRLRLQMLTGTFPLDSICERCDNTIRET